MFSLLSATQHKSKLVYYDATQICWFASNMLSVGALVQYRDLLVVADHSEHHHSVLGWRRPLI